jgi:L-threonylcarbamoyladenylate synthase
MVFIDRMQDITKVLDRDGLVLLPTDTSWVMAASSKSQKALSRIIDLKEKVSQHPITILVNSIEMFKYYCPRLHPRIETLLMYFDRPLTLVIPIDQCNLPEHLKSLNKTIAFRLTFDPFCDTIIDMMNSPLIISVAKLDSWYPRSFSDISSNILERMNYICKHRLNQSGFEPELVARFYDMGELELLRE